MCGPRKDKKKKSTNNKYWREHEEKRTFLLCRECKLVKPLWRTVWRILKKLKIELPYDPVIPLLGIYLEKTQFKEIHAPQCSHICMYTHTYTCIGMLPSHKNEITPFVGTWMDLNFIILSEVSRTEKDKYISLVCTI